jgi:hypothetical protein
MQESEHEMQENEHPSFFLWHPAIIDGGTRCAFDATAYEAQQLAQGTRELMNAFLRDLGLSAKAARWHIEPFCSPYFAADLRSPDWMDRIVRAWRIEVELEAALPHRFSPLLFRPYATAATDETWEYDEDGWNWSVGRAVVISHVPRSNTTLPYDLPPCDVPGDEPALAECRKIDDVRLTPHVCQRRFDLGTRHFPDDEPAVMQVLQAARRKCGAVDWPSSIPLQALK